MENTMQSFTPQTLMAELGSWNKQENKFRELFGPDALKDRDFQRMKLAEYDRLWQKYNGKAITTDEKALLVMLRFQRRKMENNLYPGLIRKVVRRAILLVKNVITKRRERIQLSNQVQTYSYNTIPIPEKQSGVNAEQSHQTRQQQRYGADLGRRLRHDPRKAKGQSL